MRKPEKLKQEPVKFLSGKEIRKRCLLIKFIASQINIERLKRFLH